MILVFMIILLIRLFPSFSQNMIDPPKLFTKILVQKSHKRSIILLQVGTGKPRAYLR